MKKTSLTREEKLTLETYEKKGEEWAAQYSVYDPWEPDYKKFKKLLPKGKILEIGAGGGRDAKQLHKLGFDYVGTDISTTLLKVAQKNNPKLKFLHQSVYDLKFPEKSFDGFWACAVLLHIPKSRIDEALKSIKRIIKNEGIGFITIKQGVQEGIIKDELDNGTQLSRFFALYQLDEFKDILKRNGFEILNSKIRKISERTTWLIYFVKVKNDN